MIQKRKEIQDEETEYFSWRIQEEAFNFKWQIETLNLFIWNNTKGLPEYVEYECEMFRKVKTRKINLMKKSDWIYSLWVT